MNNLPLFHYGAIYADPAWNFENYSEAGEAKNANQHYDCMDIEAIKNLPVGQLASKNCVLFMWVTDPLLQEGLDVMRAWGFKYQTVAFTWAKQARVSHDKWHMGMGYWTRANPEMCLMGTMGSPQRIDRGVRQLVIDPIREHSRKPDRIYNDIELLIEGPYLELFARNKRENWTSWGNQTEKYNETKPDPLSRMRC